jgi:Domain of unknown function (DUF6265)
MNFSVFISSVFLLFTLLNSGTCHAEALPESTPYDILTLKDKNKPIDANLENFAWLEGHWEWHANFGTPVQGDLVIGKAVHEQMLGYARGWDDNNIWFNEILVYTQQGSATEFRVKHFSYELHGREPIDQPEIHPLLKRESNVFYFDRHTIVKHDNDHYTLYVLIYDDKGNPQRYVIPHTRIKSN